jgi:hypothetical protein
MSPTEIIELFERNPDSAFRLRLSSGDEVVVENPRRTLVEDLVLIIGYGDDPDSLLVKNKRYVSIPNIALIDPVDRAQFRRRRHPRRGR